LSADIHLTYTDGMDPNQVPVGDGLFHLGTVTTKSLAESILPVAPAPHPQ
jgi:hypothetical protein